MRFAGFGILALLLSLSFAWGAGQQPVKPSAGDKCPVCGMFVAKYPDFVAAVIFRDGSHAFFDGSKDLFKYTLHLRKYAPSKRVEDIAAIYVTDYYSLEPIDGLAAWYVTGSDVFGPMGKELIPFARETEARDFMNDHGGNALLRYGDIDVGRLRGLE